MRVSWVDRIALLTRLLLAAVFVVAGASKLAHLAQFQEVLAGFRLLPGWALPAFGLALPCAELSVGVWLLLNRAARWAALCGAALLLGLITAVTVTLLRDLAPDCGCFIGIGERAVSWWLVAQDALLLTGALFVAFRATGARRPGEARVMWKGQDETRPAEPARYEPVARAGNRSWLLIPAVLIALACSVALFRQFVTQPMNALGHEGPELGEPLPQTNWVALDGGAALDTRGIGEQDVLLVFIKADCPHCRASLPQVEKLYAEVNGAGFRLLLVSESDAEPTAALARELQISAPVVLDRSGSMRTQFSLLHTPAFLWYRKGVLHDKAVGSRAVGEMGERVRNALSAMPDVARR
jgi:peroxiredoxin/uncharacterized membrane protein YphA (DoxX/SURF4 family)